MLLAVLQFELLIPGAQSIKDKRRVVKSVKDKLHREHLVSVAEVNHLDSMRVAGMALSLVGHDGKYMQGVLDTIVGKLRALPDAQLGEMTRDLISGQSLPGEETLDDATPVWTESELRDAERLITDEHPTGDDAKGHAA